MKKGSGLFGIWLRFGSVTGFFQTSSFAKSQKSSLPNGYSFSSNALSRRLLSAVNAHDAAYQVEHTNIAPATAGHFFGNFLLGGIMRQ